MIFFCKESHAPYYLSFSCFCNFLAMKILQALISKGCAAICLGVSSGQINDKVFWVKVRMHIFQIIWRTFSRQKHPLTIFLKQKQNSYFHHECERRLRIKFLIIVPNPIVQYWNKICSQHECNQYCELTCELKFTKTKWVTAYYHRNNYLTHIF